MLLFVLLIFFSFCWSYSHNMQEHASTRTLGSEELLQKLLALQHLLFRIIGCQAMNIL